MDTLYLASESCRTEEHTEFYTWLDGQQGSSVLFGLGMGPGWSALVRGSCHSPKKACS